MVITPHVIIGCFVAAKIQNRYLKNNKFDSGWRFWTTVTVLSLASHFLLDFIPHYDYNIYDTRYTGEIVAKLVLDLFLAFCFVSAVCRYATNLIDFFYKPFLALYIGAFVSILPDIINAVSVWRSTPILKWW